jgi:hypothetical protein
MISFQGRDFNLALCLVSWVFIGYSRIAPVGQKSMHAPHSTHMLLFMVGRPCPFCSMAPSGQNRTAGQAWFCGQL